MIAQTEWKVPERIVLRGKYATVQPLEQRHGEELFALGCVPDHETRYAHLLGAPPADRAAFDAWFTALLENQSRVVFVVVDNATGRVEGMQCYMNIVPAHGSIEIGAVLWGPNIARSRVSTEAFFLFSDYALSTLAYRRYEWKCNNANVNSKNAALRFGFQPEGVFRQHMVINGMNRDTAWFSILDREWPALRHALVSWLDESNFTADGRQIRSLKSFQQEQS